MNEEKDLKQETEEETFETGKTEETAETVEETEVPEESPAPENEPKTEGEGKRFWQKKKEKEKKKDPRDEEIEKLTDRLKRLMAEFDNYRKRTDKEKSQMFEMGTSATVEKILPVVDNFERGLQSVPEKDRDQAIYTGMDMIYKQLIKTLSDMGVEPIEAEGREFDPNLHNAVMQVENDDLKPGTVAAELQKGYTYKGNVIRHSMVSVVRES
ncbi:MAG: nucleotide exchange factor GrpE [Lachnospiraceae bacterium]|nr:nucleotide exchange factor GrpE [Lachnospiraceae bacterium]